MLRLCILPPGSGQRDDRVRVHCTGWTTDGRTFDSSHTRGEPASFAPVPFVPAAASSNARRAELRQVR
ncbi:hypothetical protein DB32_006128 [Sandaracinus amylolyticus]|uniref:peptidylprolyl isomerase n=1 Tax=Sandaracinus amylolyticus TaxID=927083 RepID=A0A0F6SGN0_9BACT|nr:hypothetical protein DB32_006128 [Sandaracinus amylolyticus]